VHIPVHQLRVEQLVLELIGDDVDFFELLAEHLLQLGVSLVLDGQIEHVLHRVFTVVLLHEPDLQLCKRICK